MVLQTGTFFFSQNSHSICMKYSLKLYACTVKNINGEWIHYQLWGSFQKQFYNLSESNITFKRKEFAPLGVKVFFFLLE